MIKGTIKFFNKAKGFGFITPDDGSRDVFLPPVTVTATGSARLKTGQRVSFETEPDVKGPKATKLQLLDEAPREAAAPTLRSNVTLYYDSTSDDFEEIVDVLKAAGHQPRLIDYATMPVTQDQLKRLALTLREVDQSLVRRYDHLFLELQLDDRFISENDFWTAIVEHPVLINGPVVAAGNRARICKSAGEARAFLGVDDRADDRRPKTLSPRMMAMITGRPVPAHVPAEAPRKAEPAPHKAQPAPHKAEPASKPAAAKIEAKPAAAKPEPKAKAKKLVAKKAEAPAKAKKAPAAKKAVKAKPAPKKKK